MLKYRPSAKRVKRPAGSRAVGCASRSWLVVGLDFLLELGYGLTVDGLERFQAPEHLGIAARLEVADKVAQPRQLFQRRQVGDGGRFAVEHLHRHAAQRRKVLD